MRALLLIVPGTAVSLIRDQVWLLQKMRYEQPVSVMVRASTNFRLPL